MTTHAVEPTQLTYCTNIHPGESWPEVKQCLTSHVVHVQQLVRAEAGFGVGLRLSAQAAQALATDPAELAALQTWLAERHLHVFTINMFPFGAFHGTRVKEDVYRPDWSEPARREYSDNAARVLATLLSTQPATHTGSLSTVPGGLRSRVAQPASLARIRDELVAHVATLVELSRDTGRTLRVALEPEPGCLLETTAEASTFLKEWMFSSAACSQLAACCRLPRSAAEERMRRHLGICLDACHAAVEFEDGVESVAHLEAEGIVIAKCQLSTGLRVPEPDMDELRQLAQFADEVYLHQVVVRQGDDLHRYLDLPQALAEAPRGKGTEWRVHYHVPVCQATIGPFHTTQSSLQSLLRRHAQRPLSSHVEVETYTWDVLPEAHRQTDVDEAIARELRWVEEQLAS